MTSCKAIFISPPPLLQGMHDFPETTPPCLRAHDLHAKQLPFHFPLFGGLRFPRETTFEILTLTDLQQDFERLQQDFASCESRP